MATTTDYVKLHFVVFLWGFTAILGKLVTIPSVEMVFYRTLLAAIGMGVVILVMRGSFKVSNSDLVKLLLTGFIVAMHWLTFFASGRISNPSTSLVGFATCSLWAAFLEPLAKKSKIQTVEVGLGIVVIIGLYIIFSFNFQYPMGLFLGILSGLTCAMFAVINSQLVSRVSSLTITFYEMIGACIGVVIFFPFYTNQWAVNGELNLSPTLADWLWIAVLSLVCSVYAYAVAINLTKKLSVFFIQLTLNLEPVYGIVLALLVFGEKEVMSWNFYLGTIVILGAVLSYPLVKSKFTKPLPHTGP
jgi:drug/metabolite transporter (DMT)-like permease